MYKPISVGLLPTIEGDDVLLSTKLLLKPWLWKEGSATHELEKWFKSYFGVKYAISFNSGRSAELAILKALSIGEGDEVLIQAFTCVAVPNSIIWAGAKPIYVDIIRNGYTIDIHDLEKKITERSKAIIIQHTFGIPDEIDQIASVAKKNNLYLIEDCAHALGGAYKNKKLGTYGGATFFSFGRDKVVSSVFGGMAVTNDSEIGEALIKFQKRLSLPGRLWIFKQLIYPLILTLALPVYSILSLGKIIIETTKRLDLLSLPVASGEKRGNRPPEYPKRLPNAQAMLALQQLSKLERFRAKRKAIVERYKKELKSLPLKYPELEASLIRYPILVDNPSFLVRFAQERNILLGRWYANIIDPAGTDLVKIDYQLGSCPRAEEVAKRTVNLPTSPKLSEDEVTLIINNLRDYYERHY